MCGIDVTLSSSPCTLTEEKKSSTPGCSSLDDVIQRRGPHGSNTVTRTIERTNSSLPLHLSVRATVLHIRGQTMTSQPVPIHDEDHVLCWNGEAYEILHKDCAQQTVASRDLSRNDIDSDTDMIAALLKQGLWRDGENQEPLHDWVWQQESPKIQYESTLHFEDISTEPQSVESSTEPQPRKTDTLRMIAAVMSRVWNGEYAFCLTTPNALYYGRDVWGRRSLLASNGDVWKLASVATCTNQDWMEVPPGRIYELDFATGHVHSLAIPTLRPTDATIEVDLPLEPTTIPPNVSEPMWRASFTLQHLLTKAVERRVYTANTTSKSSIGILFSGGLDSVVLAALTCQVLSLKQKHEPLQQGIQLFNVNFGSKTSADRKAAIQSFEELKELYPQASMDFCCINVQDWEQVQKHESHTLQLIHPKHTTMDLNIGTALWFASSSRHHVDESNKSCRIVLVGMGADEQMGGYGRHRTCWQKHGLEGLQAELDKDLHRLWERNLGRDDRCISDLGLEARFPFLDIHVTDFLSNLSTQNKCNMELPPGVGDKQILRLIAQRLGLVTASGLVKRAIQFGSRISHLSDTKRFKSRRKASGQATIPLRK